MQETRRLIHIDEVMSLFSGLCDSCTAKMRKSIVALQIPDWQSKMGRIIEETCREFHVNRQELVEGGNHQSLVKVRMVVAYRAREAGYSLPQIGRAINRHHTSIIHLLKKYKNEFPQSRPLR